jgi:mono/diheme cytochrome c family protein
VKRNNARRAVMLICLATAPVAKAASDPQNFDQIARGRYLTRMGDCEACHTAPGGAPFAGGRAIETPFGTILSSNITPDRDTGIGAWSDQAFIGAMQKGRGPHAAHLYPAMPYTYYTRVRRNDLQAIRTYIATITPVRNAVSDNRLPFPFNIRASLGVWNRLYFTKAEFKPNHSKSAEGNTGAYFVEGLGHCGMCHTPKTILGGDEPDHALQGYTLQGWFAPDITNDPRRGLGGWSIDDIASYLKTGHNRIAGASGPMGEEVTQSSTYATDADLRAISVYLKDQPGGAAPKPDAVSLGRPDMLAGGAIYTDLCSACHTPNGTGIPGLFPTLAGSAAVQSADPTSLIRVVLRGARTVATQQAPTGPAMPSFAADLNDAQVAAIVTYIRNAWGNVAEPVPTSRITKERASLAQRASE